MSNMTTEPRKTRCTYCEQYADVRLFKPSGTDLDVCEDHVARAVDDCLSVPRLYNLASGDELTITLKWHLS